jgi:hypothetical protein
MEVQEVPTIAAILAAAAVCSFLPQDRKGDNPLFLVGMEETMAADLAAAVAIAAAAAVILEVALVVAEAELELVAVADPLMPAPTSKTSLQPTMAMVT